ncbi:MAG: glycoside hydrolase family 125 protein, partial [Firmicutes bacterium]|nr:glycoside hydrolase family 125 protein [Bacillota bacterium]
LICPYLMIDGARAVLAPTWTRAHGWIPSMTAKFGEIAFRCTYLTPVSERAFGLRLEAVNEGQKPTDVRIGVEGQWDRTLHEVNETAELTAGREVKHSGWNHMFVWLQRPGVPLFAFAPIAEDDQPFSEFHQGAEWSQKDFEYDIHRNIELLAGGRVKLDIYFGLGYEEVAAATSAKELLRQGFDTLYRRTETWLAAREKRVADPILETLLNTNLLFAFFYASGRTVDTEELCLMTSRSPRYYVSAAYWDRDSLLWAFPAILMADAAYAREILTYVFTRQIRNIGIHSRYIDGTVLEPGFELDELCAPVVALTRYVETTGDETFIREPFVKQGLSRILRILGSKKHPTLELYETFLQPTDDLHRYPYLTYDNVLVWFALRELARFLQMPELASRAEAVKAAIYAHCVKEESGKRFFAWSTDAQGAYDIYDEPPGSLQLLPLYGFCDSTDEVWINTVAIIRDAKFEFSFAGSPIAEIGCYHAPHPWVLSVCNSLLSGHEEEALAHLRR